MATISARGSLASKRRFVHIIPVAFVTYSLAFLDRVNYGFGVAGRMGQDLRMTDRDAAAISASFFLGYFIFQIPGASYARRQSAKRIVFWALLFWGVLSSLVGLANSVLTVLLLRFFLGAVEGVVMPAMLVYLTHWFTKAERSRANTFLILGNPITLLWASAISGYLVEAFGWRVMFIAEGIPSILWAFIWWNTARDTPQEVRWLSQTEANDLTNILDAEQGELPPVKHYSAAFRDPRVVFLCVQLFFWSVGLYGLALWLPKILVGASQLGIGQVGLLSAAPYFLGAILMTVNSFLSDRSLRRTPFVWPWLLAGSIAFLFSFGMGPAHFWPGYASLVVAGGCLFAGYGPFFAIVPEMVPGNAAAESMALINSCGALGGFVGSYLIGWLNAVTGALTLSLTMLSLSLAIAGFCMLAIRAR